MINYFNIISNYNKNHFTEMEEFSHQSRKSSTSSYFIISFIFPKIRLLHFIFSFTLKTSKELFRYHIAIPPIKN